MFPEFEVCNTPRSTITEVPFLTEVPFSRYRESP